MGSKWVFSPWVAHRGVMIGEDVLVVMGGGLLLLTFICHRECEVSDLASW